VIKNLFDDSYGLQLLEYKGFEVSGFGFGLLFDLKLGVDLEYQHLSI
jgi:hypothetical protein